MARQSGRHVTSVPPSPGEALQAVPQDARTRVPAAPHSERGLV